MVIGYPWAFEDLRYEVDHQVANAYSLSAQETLALKSIDGNRQRTMCNIKILRCEPIVLPDSAYF